MANKFNTEKFRFKVQDFWFNGISTFVAYLIPSPSFEKNSSDTI